LNSSTSADELYRCDFDWIECRADHHEFPVGPEAIDQLRHCLRVWGCCQDHLGSAQLLQLLGCIRRFAVNVHARSKLLGERRVFRSAPDGGDLITKLFRELNSEVSQAAYALHRDEVAGQRATVP
jgi:hypothetical protein